MRNVNIALHANDLQELDSAEEIAAYDIAVTLYAFSVRKVC